MKKQLFLVFALLFTVAIVGCKKQDNATKPLRTKALGRWELVKIETTLSGAAAVTVDYTSSDYFYFKDGEDDILERKLCSTVQSGNYVFLTGNNFNITIDGKTYICVANTITDNNFEFTGKEGNNTIKTYLKR